MASDIEVTENPADTVLTLQRAAILFLLLIGVASLCSDATYEGARSITGPYLEILGASATAVGIIAGLGELIGYGLRIVTGYISDKTRQYWAIVLIGYGVNLIAVPMLALAGSWELAAVLMMLERMGKAIRTPAKDTMLSHATVSIGRGWGFGIYEALDQVGALIGPLIVAAILYLRGDYRAGFAVLLIPAIMTMVVLAATKLKYPEPAKFEKTTPRLETKGFPRVFWIYLLAVGLIAAAYADFPLISYHFEKTALMPTAWIPIFYAIAMGVDAVAALFFGRLFDKMGIPILAIVALISAFFAPLVFMGGFYVALLGMALWGIGMGAQESIMKAAVAEMVQSDKRGTAYGIFNTGYGVFWFLGSVVMGVLYDFSIPYLIVFSMALQLIAIPIFLTMKKAKAS